MKKILFGLFVFSFLMVGLKVSIAEAVDSQVTLFLGNTQSVVFNGQNLELELKTLDGSTGIYSLEVNGILKSASSFGAELSITDSVSLKGISYSAINSVTQSVTLQLLEKITPSITVLSPNGGESYTVGNNISITWKSNNVPENSVVTIALVDKTGSNYYLLYSMCSVLSPCANIHNGNFNVNIPNTILPGLYKARVVCNVSGSDMACVSTGYEDLSDNYFTIRAATTTPPTTEDGCSNGEVYSSTTGQECHRVVASVTYTNDLTPRISYWYGKVNQHVSVSEGMWQTDSDGVSGADLDKLTYCKKFYPNTTSVVEYKNEVINSWHDRGNLNNYTSTKMSYACVSGSIIDNGCTNSEVYSSTTGQLCQNNRDPYVKLVYPQTGSTFKVGQNVEIKIDSNLTRVGAFRAMIYRKNINNEFVFVKKFDTANSGTQTLQIPFDTSTGEYKIEYGHIISDNDYTQYGSAIFYVISATIIDNSCSAGAIYSSVTGKKCSEKDEVKDTGCIAGYNYSSMTGKPCALGLYKNDNTDVLNPITSSIKRTLKLGIKGDDVKALQAFLNLLADGSFGPKTQAKVIEWQAAHGLTADGAFGRMSREKAGLIQ